MAVGMECVTKTKRAKGLEGGVYRRCNEARMVGIVANPVDPQPCPLRGVVQVLSVLAA